MRYLLLCLTFILTASIPAAAAHGEGGVDVKEIVLGHMEGDCARTYGRCL